MAKRKKRHGPEEIVRKLRDADAQCGEECGRGVANVGSQRGHVPALGNRYGGMKSEESKRLKLLEEEAVRFRAITSDRCAR